MKNELVQFEKITGDLTTKYTVCQQKVRDSNEQVAHLMREIYNFKSEVERLTKDYEEKGRVDLEQKEAIIVLIDQNNQLRGRWRG